MIPFSIGILGAPTSGKTDLAQAVFSRWPEDGSIGPSPVVIDLDPGESIFGLRTGPQGSWRTSLAYWIALLDARMDVIDGSNVIEVGTCFDRLAHCGARMTVLNNNLLDLDESERFELVQLQQTLPTVALALVETWNYDYSFYLPVGDDADEFERGVDQALVELMESYIAAGTPLNILRLDGSTDECAEAVINIVSELDPQRQAKLKELDEAEARLRAEVGENDGLDEDSEEPSEGSSWRSAD